MRCINFTQWLELKGYYFLRGYWYNKYDGDRWVGYTHYLIKQYLENYELFEGRGFRPDMRYDPYSR